MTQEQVEDAWSKDRAALLQCGRIKHALQKFYQTRDEALSK